MKKAENEKIARILDWSGPGFPIEVRLEAAQLCMDYVQGRPNPLLDHYIQELSFGTGGMRGLIGYGPGRMNVWTVGRVSFAFCKILQRAYRRASLVIAYDPRRMSNEFAQTAAGIAANMGLKSYLFKEEAPTPILSYAVRKLKAQGGVVITASHNPPEYNGYKVYDSDGGQIVGEAQLKLEEEIHSIRSWTQIPFLSPENELYKKNAQIIGTEIRKSYIKSLGKEAFVSPASNPKKSGIKLVYTPLHGTGGAWLPAILRHYGFSVELVKEQSQPNGEFPTVKYPNPEEAEALQMADDLAREVKADMFLATDPDADRLGAGVRDAKGNYTLMSGNQLGSIMCAFLCENFYPRYPKSKPLAKKKRPMLFKTIVTTDLQKRIAETHGIELCEVLTGFKYIAEQMRELDSRKEIDRYVFGGEESFGYLPVHFVRDKDSLSVALLLCEILAECGDLNAYLDQIYLRYGLYLEDLKSMTFKGLEGQKKIEAAMEKLRREKLRNWNIGKRKIREVLDYEKQLRNGKPDPKTFKKLPSSNVLQFILEPEAKLTIRPSGTEPKIKLYASLGYTGKLSNLNDLKQAKQKLHDELHSISGQFIAHAGLLGH